jgi:hypothetical protein
MTDANQLQQITRYLNTQFEDFQKVSEQYTSSQKNTRELFEYTKVLHTTLKDIAALPQKYQHRLSEKELTLIQTEHDKIMRDVRHMQHEIGEDVQTLTANATTKPRQIQTNSTVETEPPQSTTADADDDDDDADDDDDDDDDDDAAQLGNGGEEATGGREDQRLTGARKKKEKEQEKEKEKTPEGKSSKQPEHRTDHNTSSDVGVTADVELLHPTNTLGTSSSATYPSALSQLNRNGSVVHNDNSDYDSDSDSGKTSNHSYDDSESSSRLSRLESSITQTPHTTPDAAAAAAAAAAAGKDEAERTPTPNQNRKDKLRLPQKNAHEVEQPVLNPMELTTPSLVAPAATALQRRQKMLASNATNASPTSNRTKARLPTQYTLMSLPSHISDAQKRQGRIQAIVQPRQHLR